MKRIFALILASMLLLSACGTSGGSETQTPEKEIDPNLSFSNESGEKLYIGMDTADCEKILGVGLEDNWQTSIPLATDSYPDGGLTIVSDQGIIRVIMSATDAWKPDNGMTLGMDAASAAELLGDSAKKNTDIEENELMEYYKLDEIYNCTLNKDSDGKLSGFTAAWPLESGESSTKGLMYLAGMGSGNAQLEGGSPDFRYTEISHDGTGEFKVTLNTEYIEDGVVLVDRVGAYEGTIFAPGGGMSYDIVADGNWSIWTYIPTQASAYTSETAFSGTGDHATLYLNPLETDVTGTWKVTHEGEGRFTLGLDGMYGNYSAAEPLVDESGAYSGEITITDEMLETASAGGEGLQPFLFEICSEGSWTLERVG